MESERPININEYKLSESERQHWEAWNNPDKAKELSGERGYNVQDPNVLLRGMVARAQERLLFTENEGFKKEWEVIKEQFKDFTPFPDEIEGRKIENKKREKALLELKDLLVKYGVSEEDLALEELIADYEHDLSFVWSEEVELLLTLKKGDDYEAANLKNNLKDPEDLYGYMPFETVEDHKEHARNLTKEKAEFLLKVIDREGGFKSIE